MSRRSRRDACTWSLVAEAARQHEHQTIPPRGWQCQPVSVSGGPHLYHGFADRAAGRGRTAVARCSRTTHGSGGRPTARATGRVPQPIPEQLSPDDELADLKWQIETLQSSREATQKQLQDAQLRLSMTEDQIRDLVAGTGSTGAAGTTNRGRPCPATRGPVPQEQKLQELQATIAQTEQELATAREQAGSPEATVRHRRLSRSARDGSTSRLCRVLVGPSRHCSRKESSYFRSTSRTPSGRTIPLAAAIRAAREYWLDSRVLDSAAEAYPLLIVRPQGVDSYHGCRAALDGWDDDFGYELLPADVELQYPPADPISPANHAGRDRRRTCPRKSAHADADAARERTDRSTATVTVTVMARHLGDGGHGDGDGSATAAASGTATAATTADRQRHGECPMAEQRRGAGPRDRANSAAAWVHPGGRADGRATRRQRRLVAGRSHVRSPVSRPEFSRRRPISGRSRRGPAAGLASPTSEATTGPCPARPMAPLAPRDPSSL